MAAWRRVFRLDITDVFGDRRWIEHWHCPECELRFFDGALAGGPEIYEGLQEIDWYYRPWRWEHDAALDDLPPDGRVLEVGCGVGAFLARVEERRRQPADGRSTMDPARNRVVGLELNRRAASRAFELGREVFSIPLEHLDGEPWDAICAFQVLEHVPAPGSFLDQCVARLRRGGRLLLAVPDRESFLHLEPRPLLDLPPHHVSRWSRATLAGLERRRPLRLVRLENEPLAAYDVTYYCRLHLRRLLPTPWIRAAGLDRLLGRVLRRTGLRRRLRGHTLYAVFERSGDDSLGRAPDTDPATPRQGPSAAT